MWGVIDFWSIPGGAVAQLGARLDGIEEVVGSNPIGSTILKNPKNLRSKTAARRLAHLSGSKCSHGPSEGHARRLALRTKEGNSI